MEKNQRKGKKVETNLKCHLFFTKNDQSLKYMLTSIFSEEIYE